MSIRFLRALAALLVLSTTAPGCRWGPGEETRVAPPAGARGLAGLGRLAEAFPAPEDAGLEWPRDHGAKPEQFIESWLFAGLLEADDDARYGFQLEISRVATQPGALERDSAWAARDVFRARLSVEPAGKPAQAAERISRAVLGLAGAGRSPARAWLEDWRFDSVDEGKVFLLRAGDADTDLELRLIVPEAGAVEVAGPGYRGYWWPGLGVAGTLGIGGRRVDVSGRAMLDRLWGRALPFGQGQLAMTRFWLEDGDGGAIRCERLQRRSGGGTPLLECLGVPELLRDAAFRPVDGGVETVAGVRLPLQWETDWPSHRSPLRVEPLSHDRELSFDATWAGVVTVASQHRAWGLLVLSNFDAP